MVSTRGIIAGACTAVAVVAAALNPALATSLVPSRTKPRAAARSLSNAAIGSFTPAAADPRLAAALSRSLNSGSFRFTPSMTPGSRRDVTVAVRARATTAAEAQRTVTIASSAITTPTSVTPSAYNLGVAVGWKRFALAGDVSRIDTGPMPGSREAVDVALGYGGPKWSTKLQLGADRATGNDGAQLVGTERAYSVDLGGSYALTRNLDVTGGVRYRVQRDRLDAFADQRRDSQAVYIGTAFRF